MNVLKKNPASDKTRPGFILKNLVFIIFFIGFTFQGIAQDPIINLSEVIVKAVNYKYLNQVDNQAASVPVEMLQRKVATYDIKSADFYDDEYDYYTVSFYIPEGKIVAAYDSDGKIIRTIEKFKDIALPTPIAQAVAKRFPEWTVSKDVYLLRYHNEKGTKKTYKLTLENGDQRIKIKTDGDGNFI